MPHHPSEEETESNVFDKVAKGNPESNASDHPLHRENQEPVKASAADHKSKGPVIPDSRQTPSLTGSKLDADLIPEMPEAASKEDLKARAQEMNK
jgi:hypothetical protein